MANLPIPKHLSVELSKSLTPPIQDAFLQHFQMVLVPSFEKACQNMFVQIHNSFQQGVQEFRKCFARGSRKYFHLCNSLFCTGDPRRNLDIERLETQMKQIQSSLDALTASLEKKGSSLQQPKPPKKEESKAGIQKELSQMIRSDQYDQAFSKVNLSSKKNF